MTNGQLSYLYCTIYADPSTLTVLITLFRERVINGSIRISDQST